MNDIETPPTAEPRPRGKMDHRTLKVVIAFALALVLLIGLNMV
jgi:hypothetical protein